VRCAKVCAAAIPFLLFHEKEEFQLVDSLMRYTLCVMQESVANKFAQQKTAE